MAEKALWLVLEDEAVAREHSDRRARLNALGTRVRLYDFLGLPERAVDAAQSYLDARKKDQARASSKDPDDRYLEIKLDEENQFVRTEHLVSAIFDYLNLTDNEVADEIYRRLDIDKLDNRLTRERSDIQEWLQRAFPAAEEQYIQTVLDEIDGYVQRTKAPITPPNFGDEIEPFWKSARIPRGTNQSELESRLDELKFKRQLFDEIAKGNINLGDGA